jgi:hypothetical protein
MLYWKVGAPSEGMKPGKLKSSESRQITSEEWNTMLTLLQSTDFWKMPTTKRSLGTDGSQWIIEGMDNGRYHVVDRWSPKNDNFEKVGTYMIKLAGMKERY